MTDTPAAEPQKPEDLPNFQPWQGQPPRQVRIWAVEQAMHTAQRNGAGRVTTETVLTAAAALEAYVLNGADAR